MTIDELMISTLIPQAPVVAAWAWDKIVGQRTQHRLLQMIEKLCDEGECHHSDDCSKDVKQETD